MRCGLNSVRHLYGRCISGGDGGSASGGSSAGVASAGVADGSSQNAANDAALDAAWLLRHHCYVRAVGVQRRPVTADEREMASCKLRAPSGQMLSVSDVRFMALEQLFAAQGATDASTAIHATGASIGALRGGGAAVGGATSPSDVASCQGVGSGFAAVRALDGCARINSDAAYTGAGKRHVRAQLAKGAIDVLRSTIEAASRPKLADLYATIVLAGVAGSVPGLRQRCESELRYIRSQPDMPRTLRPQLATLPGSHSGSHSSRAAGHALLGIGGTAATELSSSDTAMWPLSAAETCAWTGAAQIACDQLGRRAVDRRQPWTTADHFEREPRYCARSALRAAGAPVAHAAPGKGGHWGGSGLARTVAGAPDGFTNYR